VHVIEDDCRRAGLAEYLPCRFRSLGVGRHQ
jgi:hypothetical protein